jgi:hypothetical protein
MREIARDTMKAFFFVIGFIWLLGGGVSLVLAPLVGLDRRRLRVELRELWESSAQPPVIQFSTRCILIFGHLGFLLPVVHPFVGISVGILFLGLGGN